MSSTTLSTGLCAQLACVWEATARKPGNVHPSCDFEDVTYLDFLHSAAAIAPILDSAQQRELSTGQIVLEGVKATRLVASTNTNLGILLLLAPMVSAVARNLKAGLEAVLSALTFEDSRSVYEAIRLASPGGIGKVSNQDIRTEPTEPLRQVMALAAKRDLIAMQYVNGFHEILAEGLPALQEGLQCAGSLEGAIIFCQLQLLAGHPDSLITRKRGREEAVEASRRAREVLHADWPKARAARSALHELDDWLRAKGHQRNPGTTADLVTACLFALLREGNMELPLKIPFAAKDLYG